MAGTIQKNQDMDLIQALDRLINDLHAESPSHVQAFFASYPRQTLADRYEIFRGYCNIRPPKPMTPEFLELQDDVLTRLNMQRSLVDWNTTPSFGDHIHLWQGDITTLKVDAIVNAANSDMLGCTQANHDCIDNAIHTRAGIQLRLACHELMEAQGRKESMGKAKITPAFNLPCQYVIHTVGPYIDGKGVTPIKESLLRSSYRACLSLADQYGLESVAFCCISTGEFHFPNEQAARIAIDTVTAYLQETGSEIHVIFNVFLDKDAEIYQSLLAGL